MTSADVPKIQFADARGARLAYQDFGRGDHTIVAIPPTAQNIEVAWERPEIRSMLERFGSFSRYIHFDKRGTGASGRRSRVNVIDERVDDLRAVMDAAGVERAHLFAASEGGPMAILFAVSYPNRVRSLILFGTGARLVREVQTADEAATREAAMRRFSEAWGTPHSPVVDGFAPSLAGDQDFRTWHQRYERLSCTPESMYELLQLSYDTDIREALGRVSVPTLVIHRRGDRIVPIEYGRDLADGIPGAVLFEQDGTDHFGYAGDVDGWMDELERWVTGSVTSQPVTVGRPRVEIVTLGRFAIMRNGREVPSSEWGSRLARQLCKRLVVARGWPVPRDLLMDLLWPDELDRSRLRGRLSVQLSGVRRMLDGGIVATRESVRLDLDEVSTDLERFFSATDPGAIVAAYPGEFLPTDLYEDWAREMRDAVRTRFVTAVRESAEQLLAFGSPLAAVRVVRRILAVDRYDDAAHRMVVEALISAGEMGEAASAHQAWHEALAELELVPPPFEAFT